MFSNKAVTLSDARCFDCVLHLYHFIVSHYSPTCSSVLQVFFSGFEQQIIFCPAVALGAYKFPTRYCCVPGGGSAVAGGVCGKIVG